MYKTAKIQKFVSEYIFILCNILNILRAYATNTVRPIKKFTFRSYGTVSLFNYVRARYAVQLTYL